MHPLHEQNRRAWNEATAIHQRHRGDLAAFFRAGGSTLHLHDDHPMANMLDESLRIRWSYFHSAEPEVSAGLDYVGQSGEGVERNYQWQWSVGDLVEAVTGAGLCVRYLREHPYTFFRRWPQLIERDRCYFLPQGVPAIPLSFTLRADRH